MRVLLHELRTGEMLRELEFTELIWSTGVCRADEITVTVPGYVAGAEGLRGLAVPRRTAVSVVRDDGVCLAAGVTGQPVASESDDGTPRLELTARGIESVFEKRVILPPGYGDLVDANGYPDPRYDTRISGVDYGTMMQRLYRQAVAHPGGGLPVAWEEPRAGIRSNAWVAVDGKRVQEAVEDLSELADGVEWDWVPRVDEADRLSWALITGTAAQPEISSAIGHYWVAGGAAPAVRKLREKTNPEFLASSAFFLGGKNDDRVLISQRTDPSLLDEGFPLAEVWDTSHSTTSDQAALNGWADAALRDAEAPIQFWSFDVRADRAHGLRHGDWCVIEVSDHWWIPDGAYQRRIVEVSGGVDSAWLGVTVSGMQEW